MITSITIFTLSVLAGFEVIGKVPSTLHTPLMSATNAIHGVVLVGALLIAVSVTGFWGYLLLFTATALATMNVVGGYLVTDRMLDMFRPPARDRDGTR